MGVLDCSAHGSSELELTSERVPDSVLGHTHSPLSAHIISRGPCGVVLSLLPTETGTYKMSRVSGLVGASQCCSKLLGYPRT